MYATISTTDGLFHVKSPYNPRLVTKLKQIDGRRWDGNLNTWTYPATPASAAYLYDLFTNLPGWDYDGDTPFLTKLVEHKRAEEVLTLNLKAEDVTPTPSFEHQRIGLALLKARPGAYLAHDMGVGKSKVVIDLINILNLSRTLIICPKSVVPEWPIQFERHSNGTIPCIPLFKGSVKKRTERANEAIQDGPCALVINYEAVWREPFGNWALEQKWDLVVGDELHKCKEGRSKASSYFNQLRNHAKRRVGLSGTPIPNNPLELWAQCRFLDPGLFGLSYVAFRNRYAIMGGYGGKEVVGYRNLEDLHKKFYTLAHRVTKAKVLDLPPTLDERRTAVLGTKAARVYQELENQLKSWLEEGDISVPNAITKLLRLQQLTGGAVTLDEKHEPLEVDTAKAEALAEIFNNLPASEPIVVFCRFHHDLDIVHRVAHDCGRDFAELSGRRKQLHIWRDANDKGFQQPTILAVQISAGSLGVDLSRACYAVYYSLGFSLGEYEQSKARLHRQGQTRNVTYIHLVTELPDGGSTVDNKVYMALKAKQKVVDAVLEELRKGT